MSKGGVYILKVDGEPYVKIGFAGNIKARLQGYRALHYKPLLLINFLETKNKIEEVVLHERYAGLRVNGEWYKYCESMHTVSFLPAENPILRAIQIVGSDKELAKHIAKRLKFSKYFSGGDLLFYARSPWKIPSAMATAIEKITEGKVIAREFNEGAVTKHVRPRGGRANKQPDPVVIPFSAYKRMLP